MAQAVRRIPINKKSELGRQMDEARRAGEQVVLEVNGQAYRLTSQPQTVDDPWKEYDAEKVRQALRRNAGTLKGVDRDALVADLKEQRAQNSHGRPA